MNIRTVTMKMMKQTVEHAILFRIYFEHNLIKVRDFSTNLSEVMELEATGVKDRWLDPNGEKQLRLLTADLNDTLVVEVVWNSDGEDAFWKRASKNLHSAVEETITNFRDLKIRGWTKVFQACIVPEQSLDDVDAYQVIKEEGLSYHSPNYSQEIAGGRLWLLNIPRKEDKEVVYLALCCPEDEAALGIALNDLELILKDIITHKTCQCGRSVQRILDRYNLNDLVFDLSMSIKGVLDEVDVLSDEQNQRLMKLAFDYDGLLDASLVLEPQRTSLAQQEWNFNSLIRDKPIGEIDQFFCRRIIGFKQDVDLKCDQCQRMLSGAEKVTNIARARIEEARSRIEERKEQRRQRLEVLIAFTGIFLALPELFQFETLERVLTHYGFSLSDPMIFLIQILITLFTASSLAFVVWIVGNKIRKKQG
mgnify:CR=1 FL=1